MSTMTLNLGCVGGRRCSFIECIAEICNFKTVTKRLYILSHDLISGGNVILFAVHMLLYILRRITHLVVT